MKRTLACAATSALALLGALLVPTASLAGPPSASTEAAAVAHSLSVSGAGVALAPAYDAAIDRYAVRTTGAWTGALTVHAATADPAGRVRVNGRPLSGASVALTGLEAGDEVSVMYDDAGGHAVHSLIVLPAAFPALDGTGPAPGVAEGSLLLTMNSWNADPDRFHAIVDDWGVPRWLRREPVASHDLRLQPNGSFTWSAIVPNQGPEQNTDEIVETNARFEEVARHRTVGLVNTDFHDSLLRADGSRLHIAYEYDPERFVTHAVIQDINAADQVTFQWSTRGHVVRHEETVVDLDDPIGRMDYAHINSVTETPDGHLLASFRGLSSVLKIARFATGEFQPGDVMWRLGGRRSDFTFVDDPYDGPCAQHTATMLPNGNVMVFDNGSNASDAPGDVPERDHPGFCVDPTDPDGPTHERLVTRYVEWDLDEGAGTATMVRQYAPGVYAPFTGSAFPLDNDNTLIGWGAAGFLTAPTPASPTRIATELDATGEKVWELTSPTRQGSYRVYREDVPDAFAPVVDLVTPAAGATYALGQQVRADFGCTDTGGSNLVSCDGSLATGAALPTTTPGTRTFEVVAVDGDGNRTVERRSYTVLPAPTQPPVVRGDLALRVGTGSFTGIGRFSPDPQQASARLPRLPEGGRVKARVRLVNRGAASTAYTLSASRPGWVRAAWFLGRKDVTRRLQHGRLTTDQLGVGGSLKLRLVLTTTRRSEAGDRTAIKVAVTPVGSTGVLDRVKLKIRVPGS